MNSGHELLSIRGGPLSARRTSARSSQRSELLSPEVGLGLQELGSKAGHAKHLGAVNKRSAWLAMVVHMGFGYEAMVDSDVARNMACDALISNAVVNWASSRMMRATRF